MSTDDVYLSKKLFYARLGLAGDIIRPVNLFLSTFGVASNLLVILVFLKDGLSTTSNRSFFYLALTDLYISLYWVLQLSRAYLHLRGIYIRNWKIIVFIRLYVADSAEAMNSIGAWITAVITTERLCCIAIPMKVSINKNVSRTFYPIDTPLVSCQQTTIF